MYDDQIIGRQKWSLKGPFTTQSLFTDLERRTIDPAKWDNILAAIERGYNDIQGTDVKLVVDLAGLPETQKYGVIQKLYDIGAVTTRYQILD